MDLVVEVPAVAGCGTDDEDEDKGEGAAHPSQRALARAALRGCVGGAASLSLAGPWFRAPPGVARLVDLAPELVQPVFDGVGGRAGPITGDPTRSGVTRSGVTRSGVGRRSVGCVDLASQLVQALLHGVVLGFVRAHGAMVWETCDRMIWSAPMPRGGSGLGRRNAWSA